MQEEIAPPPESWTDHLKALDDRDLTGLAQDYRWLDEEARADEERAKAERAGEKTKDAAEKVGEKTKDTAGTAGEAITDAWITTKIKADFINEDALKGSDINVDTNNHVVTLTGTVASLAGKSRAEQIAKTTKGVTRVINTLTVTPK